MWDLIQILMGEAQVIDFALTYSDCTTAAAQLSYLADGMATYICETNT